MNYNPDKILADLESPEYRGAFVVCDFMFTYKHSADAEKGYFKAMDCHEIDGNSDHWPFALKNVPCIFLMNEGGDAYKYYHTVDDTYKNTIFANYEPIFNLIKDFIEKY